MYKYRKVFATSSLTLVFYILSIVNVLDMICCVLANFIQSIQLEKQIDKFKQLTSEEKMERIAYEKDLMKCIKNN